MTWEGHPLPRFKRVEALSMRYPFHLGASEGANEGEGEDALWISWLLVTGLTVSADPGPCLRCTEGLGPQPLRPHLGTFLLNCPSPLFPRLWVFGVRSSVLHHWGAGFFTGGPGLVLCSQQLLIHLCRPSWARYGHEPLVFSWSYVRLPSAPSI